MRMSMVCFVTLACLVAGAIRAAPAIAADIYAPAPQVYGAPPPPAYGPPPQAYGPPPAAPPYGPAPAQVYGPPPLAYAAPGPGYLPGTEYEQPIYVEGQPYYRECWWDWGRRRCELRPWR